MTSFVKQGVALAVAGITAFVAYYGTYLPLHKSRLFIEVIEGRSDVRTLQDFEKVVSVPLNASSPIGQEELVRNFANSILELAQRTPSNQPEVIRESLRFLDSYYKPIIDRGRGMSFEQDLYILGALNELAFVRTRGPDYLEAAGKYFAKGVELGPNRPQSLQGLFDVYRLEGDVQNAATVGARILELWPNDDRAREILGQFLKQTRGAKKIDSK